MGRCELPELDLDELMILIVDIQLLNVNLRLQAIPLENATAVWAELQVRLDFRILVSRGIIDRKHHVEAGLSSCAVIDRWLV